MMKAIIFDLDGTLLPVDQETFTKAYFARLGRRVAKLGFDPKRFIDCVWQGTRAMFRNDGTRRNDEVFWTTLPQALGQEIPGVREDLDDFYRVEFGLLGQDLGPFPDRSGLLRRLEKRGFQLVLASNPVFPIAAVEHRLHWLGLERKDFVFVTDYESCTYCKPALGYYQQICERLGRPPRECLMVGNSVPEDALPMEALGGQAFLLTDMLEGDPAGLERFPHGDWTKLETWLAALPDPV